MWSSSMIGLKLRRTPCYVLQHDGDAAAVLAHLEHWHRELTTGEEARLLTIHCDQVWLGQPREGASWRNT